MSFVSYALTRITITNQPADTRASTNPFYTLNMVYCGKASLGCSSCRKRRIKVCSAIHCPPPPTPHSPIALTPHPTLRHEESTFQTLMLRASAIEDSQSAHNVCVYQRHVLVTGTNCR